MTKIAFMFPGQGSFAAGMGKDIAEAVPEAMAIYEEGSEASGMDLKELCFNGPLEALVDTEVQQPALVRFARHDDNPAVTAFQRRRALVESQPAPLFLWPMAG